MYPGQVLPVAKVQLNTEVFLPIPREKGRQTLVVIYTVQLVESYSFLSHLKCRGLICQNSWLDLTHFLRW